MFLETTRRHLVKATAIVLALAGGQSATADPIPVYEFLFNGSGTTAASTGSVADSGTMLNVDGTATDLHSADATGVSGLPGDRAFDNSASTGMGPNGTGGRVAIASPSSLNGATAVTVMGWYRTLEEDYPIGASAVLVDLGISSGDDAGLNIVGGGQGSRLRVNIRGNVGGTSLNQNLQGALLSSPESQEWVFFAVTYDSSIAGEDNMWLYHGTTAGNVQLVGSTEITTGPLAISGNNEFAIGNANGGNIRPFDGLIDNVRVYDAALTVEQLETLRINDIPEPTSAALTAGLALMLLRRR